MENILNTAFRSLPPLLLAGLGGMITAKVGLLNLGLEGMMLVGAFTAVIVNYFTGSAFAGLLAAILVCSFMGLVFAVFYLKFKVDNIIISVAFNMFALAITQYLLGVLFGTSGAFASDKIRKLPEIPIPFLENIPVLRAFNSLSVIFWLALLITAVLSFVINRTTWGLHIRATGLNDNAVNTAGVNATRVRYICVILSGSLCGMGGAYLSTGYLAMFTNNMTAGRGYLGNIASIIGNRTAGGALAGSLLFSFTEGITMKIQAFGFPSQLIQLIPYLAAFAVVIASACLKRRKGRTA
ncbi:MAG TPA: ABC transporter permease [Candidatus Lachnoclostridium stercorigallinarum]|uniref:ABC transporter permease n=1 Tax=Candidatus Lachnoclostridium stercorigallinarum TaxID=2838634 RepID=A0A9D2GGQ6_9FIRM|nr:ABC transporter permease [Candidatus Lachnoclostridium stercorigallinarum]